MSFFSRIPSLVRETISGAFAVFVVPVTEDAAGDPQSLKSDASGLLVSLAGLSNLATAAAQAVLAALVATPGTPSAITKSNDTVTTTITAKGILVGGAGNLVVKPAAGGDDVTLVVVAGQYVPLQCSRVMAATTATGLVGLS